MATAENSEGGNQELRIRKALESLSPLQEAHRHRLQQQLEVLTIQDAEAVPVEPVLEVSPVAWDSRDPLSGLEREYVARVVATFQACSRDIRGPFHRWPSASGRT